MYRALPSATGHIACTTLIENANASESATRRLSDNVQNASQFQQLLVAISGEMLVACSWRLNAQPVNLDMINSQPSLVRRLMTRSTGL